MKCRVKLFFVCLIVTVLGCDEPSYVYQFPDSMNADDARLSKVGIKRIALDSTLGITNQSVVYYEDPEPRVSILNRPMRKIHVFDYETGKQLYAIHLDEEGENGLGNMSNVGHYMVNEDSIFLSHHWESRIYMINREGKVLSKYDLKTDLDAPSFYLMNDATSKMKLVGNELFISAQSSFIPSVESCYLLKLNLQDSSVSYHIQEPKILTDYFWGTITPFQLSTAFTKDKMVTSFAKNPELEVYALDNLDVPINTHVAGSKFVKSFESFPKKNSKPTLFGYAYNEIAPLTNRQSMFTSIDYDLKSKSYIRTMLLPRTEEQYEMRGKGMELTYIILNEAFEKIGETKMPRGRYSYSSFFVNDIGMHLVNLEEYAKGEDYLTFDIYEISY